MASNYIQPGNVMDYVNSGAEPILSGDVVPFADCVGVAKVNIAPGEVGSVQLSGVFALPKKTGEVLAQGVIAFWTEDGVAAAGAIKAGRVWVAADAVDETVPVKLIG